MRAQMARPALIVSNVDFLVELLVDMLLSWPIGLVKRWRADRRMSRGRFDCALKVISGGQRGLSQRWRHVAATAAPGRLDIRGHWWRLFRAIPPVTVVDVRGPVRPPSGQENWSLAASCRIIEIQTPTATLGWAVPGHYLPGALERLQARSADSPSNPTA
jgi:hypothetical protein